MSDTDTNFKCKDVFATIYDHDKFTRSDFQFMLKALADTDHDDQIDRDEAKAFFDKYGKNKPNIDKIIDGCITKGRDSVSTETFAANYWIQYLKAVKGVKSCKDADKCGPDSYNDLSIDRFDELFRCIEIEEPKETPKETPKEKPCVSGTKDTNGNCVITKEVEKVVEKKVDVPGPERIVEKRVPGPEVVKKQGLPWWATVAIGVGAGFIGYEIGKHSYRNYYPGSYPNYPYPNYANNYCSTCDYSNGYGGFPYGNFGGNFGYNNFPYYGGNRFQITQQQLVPPDAINVYRPPHSDTGNLYYQRFSQQAGGVVTGIVGNPLRQIGPNSWQV
jgi:hypothetical protein